MWCRRRRTRRSCRSARAGRRCTRSGLLRHGSGSVRDRRGRRSLQVELRSEVIEAFPEAELIGLPEELSKWLCVPIRRPDLMASVAQYGCVRAHG
jgi:hypothetical protein